MVPPTPHTDPKRASTEVRAFFHLIWQLAVVEFNLRNEGSYLGNVWYLLNPVLLFLLLYLIFFDRLGGAIPSYPAYLILGILPFTFFVRTTMDSTKAIVGNSLIKSFSFKREALVLSIVLKNLFSHFFEVVVFFILLFFLGVPWYGIFIYLPLLFLLSVFVYGVGLFLSALTIYFADLENIWQFFTTLLWFVTPIFYAIEGQVRLFALNLFNPLYYFIAAARDSIVYGTMPQWGIMTGMVAYAFFSLVIGTAIFKKMERAFPEMV